MIITIIPKNVCNFVRAIHLLPRDVHTIGVVTLSRNGRVGNADLCQMTVYEERGISPELFGIDVVTTYVSINKKHSEESRKYLHAN